MSAQSIERTGVADGNRWKALIDVSPGGQFSIRSLDVTSSDGTAFPTYTERTAKHDTLDEAVSEADELARSIARSE
jgi:hypothetical protein